jgi:hypothetical protein
MPRWTAASREKQRRLINRVRPWESSTGPVTPHGKKQSARNGPNHAPRAPGTHPAELRQQRARLWKLWRLQLEVAPLGIFDPAWAMSLADRLVVVEAALGLDPAETQHRLTGSLVKLAKHRVRATATAQRLERGSERNSDSVAFCHNL